MKEVKKDSTIKKGSFEFYTDYAEKEMDLQPEHYHESRRIFEGLFIDFKNKYKKKPVVLDVGAAGLLPYDLKLTEKTVILDLFNKPKQIILEKNCFWIKGDILTNNLKNILPPVNFDFIIMGGLLHHLCTQNNNSLNNVALCFSNSKKLLSKNGKLIIIEHLMPSFIPVLEDLLYPIYNWILINLFKFTYVRFLSKKEVLKCLKIAKFKNTELSFKQPPYIAQLYWKIPKRLCLGRLVAMLAKPVNN